MKSKREYQKTIITTPIYYPNANLHIGHAYTNILADVLSRFRKLQGRKVMFVTGSDEHGQKLLDKAQEAQKEVYDYVSEIVENFKNLWNKLDIEYDVFVRTTDEIHKNKVQKIFSFFNENNFIYKGKYSGFYCKSDESYFTKSQLDKGNCPICGRSVEIHEEDSYFLKIVEFKEWIKNLIMESNLIYPNSRANELIGSFIEDLEDLSISRSNIKWGIPVPNDPSHVIYVWFDALINYLSSFDYPTSNLNETDWDDNSTEIVQFLGKEIIRFHAIYWPIILKMLSHQQPKLLSHGWIIVEGEKMSKSLGNVVDPLEKIALYGSDALRFYLVKSISFGNDGKYSDEGLLQTYNGILVNKFSNLINRTFEMNSKYFDSVLPNSKINLEFTKDLDLKLKHLEEKIFSSMDEYQFNDYLDYCVNYLDELNLYIDKTTPWKETNQEVLSEIIWYLVNRIYSISVLLNPIIPNSTKKVFVTLGLEKEIHRFDELFKNIKNVKIANKLILFERKK